MIRIIREPEIVIHHVSTLHGRNRLAVETRVNPQSVHLGNQDANVMSDELRVRFVLLGKLILGTNRLAELPLNHRHGRFHVASDMILRHVLLLMQREVMERLFV
jgi:hypothetical protein